MTFRAVPGGSVRQPGRMINSGGFNPASLFAAGEQGLWYDPSNFATMFQDTGGTTPVTSVGQPVGKILDLSGKNNHATFSNVTLQQDGAGKFYLAFNGTTSTGVTAAIDFSATDELSLWAGTRKLSDAATQVVCELGTNSGTVAGTFALFAAQGAAANLVFRGHGTTSADNTRSGLAAPITTVLACSDDISASICSVKVNGAAGINNATSQGTGNFSSNQFFIGSRAGTSLFFNGNIYSLIIRGVTSTAAQLAGGETYVNSKTGAF